MRLVVALCLCLAVAHGQSGSRIDLASGWLVQSSAKVPEKGDTISSVRFRPLAWYPASVPTTVLSALVRNKVYADPEFGMNLRSIPGTTYNIGMNFSNLPMPADSPFAVPWWYRTRFKVPTALKGKRLWLNFDAINYRADIWLNGRRVANSNQAVGMYRMFEFDVTDLVVPGADNVLAVEVTAPTQNDLTITFVDWNPMPPDKDMGLVRDVYLRVSGPVSLRNTQVVSHVDRPRDRAGLTLYTDLKNASNQPVEGMLKATMGAIAVSKKVRLTAGQATTVSLAPEDDAQLTIEHPKLWWPYGLGAQELYRLRLEFESGGALSDAGEVTFGIREITSEMDAQQH